MEYFVLQYDERINRPLKLDFSQRVFEGEEPFIIYAELDEDTQCADYFCGKKLFNYYFCVSDELKELLDIYATNLKAVPFFVTSKKRQEQKVYWKIDIHEEDCLIHEPFMRYDKLKLMKEPTANPYIFRVVFEKQHYLIVSLHLAENILRKDFYGIRFVPVQVKEA